MGRFRTFGVALVGALAVSALAATAGAVPAKSRALDACALIASSDLASLSATYAVENTDDLSAKNCLYSLQGDGESTTVNLFVDKTSDFSMQKAIVSKAKKVSGLPSGYVGTIPGGTTQVGFKSGSVAIRLTSDGLEGADLALVAKAVKKHL